MTATPVAKELDPVTVIISQPTAPVEIYQFSRSEDRDERAGPVDAAGRRQTIFSVSTRWRNIVDRVIVAVEIGVLHFDVWHEFLEYWLVSNFERLDPRDDDRSDWNFLQSATPVTLDDPQHGVIRRSQPLRDDRPITLVTSMESLQ